MSLGSLGPGTVEEDMMESTSIATPVPGKDDPKASRLANAKTCSMTCISNESKQGRHLVHFPSEILIMIFKCAEENCDDDCRAICLGLTCKSLYIFFKKQFLGPIRLDSEVRLCTCYRRKPCDNCDYLRWTRLFLYQLIDDWSDLKTNCRLVRL
jgi:hypothetical protein